MTKSRRQEGARGNRRVPPRGRAAAEQRRRRGGGTRGRPGLPRATKPKAREAGEKRPPALDPALVEEFVSKAHGDVDAVQELLEREPALVNAAWDWGGGDWETGLGAAAHMGGRDIALFLLERGARLDVFAAAMLGHVDIVRAILGGAPGDGRGARPTRDPTPRSRAAGRRAGAGSPGAARGAARSRAVIFEVFRQERKGQAFVHGGSFHAPNREFADAYAREFYARRQESVALWVVPREEIMEIDEFPDEFDLKYRRVDGYSIKARLKEARDRAGTLES